MSIDVFQIETSGIIHAFCLSALLMAVIALCVYFHDVSAFHTNEQVSISIMTSHRIHFQ